MHSELIPPRIDMDTQSLLNHSLNDAKIARTLSRNLPSICATMDQVPPQITVPIVEKEPRRFLCFNNGKHFC
jgi:hypothetical protein